MKKTIQYNKGENKLYICFPFTENHLRTLVIILGNDGSVDFENRDNDLKEDIDGNEISWKLCDELVEMDLLHEDEESPYVSYDITEYGEFLIKNMK
jgi:hypothetical protein